MRDLPQEKKEVIIRVLHDNATSQSSNTAPTKAKLIDTLEKTAKMLEELGAKSKAQDVWGSMLQQIGVKIREGGYGGDSSPDGESLQTSQSVAEVLEKNGQIELAKKAWEKIFNDLKIRSLSVVITVSYHGEGLLEKIAKKFKKLGADDQVKLVWEDMLERVDPEMLDLRLGKVFFESRFGWAETIATKLEANGQIELAKKAWEKIRDRAKPLQGAEKFKEKAIAQLKRLDGLTSEIKSGSEIKSAS